MDSLHLNTDNTSATVRHPSFLSLRLEIFEVPSIFLRKKKIESVISKYIEPEILTSEILTLTPLDHRGFDYFSLFSVFSPCL